MPQKFIVRKFCFQDREAVRQIAIETTLMGHPAYLFFEGAEVVSDALSRYFTDYEPESCFVAEVDGKVVGYLMGALKKATAEKIFNQKIALPLLLKVFKSGVLLKPKNLIFIYDCLLDLLKNGIKTPSFIQAYPAILHINLRDGYRGQGLGAGLINAYFDYLKKNKVSGVHLATMSEQAANFFFLQGFKLLYRGKRSYFKRILRQDVPLYIFGKLLS